MRDWRFSKQYPLFFKHDLDLYLWRQESFRWLFTASGVYAREEMFKGCRVLDLCCGDGSYSYLFYSDIAEYIDCVDYEPTAIKYGQKYFNADNINYHRLSITESLFPQADYDFVIWNSAISYFTAKEGREILKKIKAHAKHNFLLIGDCPLGNNYIDHKNEFPNEEALSTFLKKEFKEVRVKVINKENYQYAFFKASNSSL